MLKNYFKVIPFSLYTKTFNLDVITNENNADHNPKQLYTPNHLYTILIIGSSGPGKTSTLLNLIREQGSDVFTDKIYLYNEDLNEPNYQLLIKKREKAGTYLDKPQSKSHL